MDIELKILNKKFYSSNLPTYATAGSAAIDLVCTNDVTLYPGETKMIATGLAIHIGSAYPYCGQSSVVAGLIIPRSGLGSKGLVLANTIGLIDEDYQNELMVNALNRNKSEIYKDYSDSRTDEFGTYGVRRIEQNVIEIKAGDRFAQLMFVPIIKPQFKVVDEFSTTTARAGGGFGSTGN
jgi:dUTP pyrophosphatase